MLQLFVFAVAVAAPGEGLQEPVRTSLCSLYEDPAAFAGKLIVVRATIRGAQEPALEAPASSAHEPCKAYMRLLLALPDDVDKEPEILLERDATFIRYEDARRRKGRRIEATLEGRFEPVFTWRMQERIRITQGDGYGKGRWADGRLILKKITDLDVKAAPAH